MQVARVSFLSAGFLGALLSCAGPRSSGPTALAPSEQLPWRDALTQATRRIEPYDGLLRQADVRATLITPRVRKAFATARREFHGQFAAQAERELLAFGEPDAGVDVMSRPKPESEEQVVFFVAMYVSDQKNRDISASYTIWETTLERGDARVKPLHIEVVRGSPSVTAVFPYADRFDDLYLVRFPLTDVSGRAFLSPGAEPLRLHIHSALADATLDWTLAE